MRADTQPMAKQYCVNLVPGHPDAQRARELLEAEDAHVYNTVLDAHPRKKAGDTLDTIMAAPAPSARTVNSNTNGGTASAANGDAISAARRARQVRSIDDRAIMCMARHVAARLQANEVLEAARRAGCQHSATAVYESGLGRNECSSRCNSACLIRVPPVQARSACICYAVAFGVVGVVLLAIIFASVHQQRAERARARDVQSWQEVRATILKVVPHYDTQCDAPSTCYTIGTLTGSYSYSIAGQNYTADTFGVGTTAGVTDNLAQYNASARTGTPVRAWVDPGNPASATLDRTYVVADSELSGGSIAVALIFFVVLALVVGGSWWFKRSAARRQQQEAARADFVEMNALPPQGGTVSV